jgi:hypothetical protein
MSVVTVTCARSKSCKPPLALQAAVLKKRFVARQISPQQVEGQSPVILDRAKDGLAWSPYFPLAVTVLA